MLAAASNVGNQRGPDNSFGLLVIRDKQEKVNAILIIAEYGKSIAVQTAQGRTALDSYLRRVGLQIQTLSRKNS